MRTIHQIIIETAAKYVGQKELKGNSGFVDDSFWAKMDAVGFDEGDAWCALFGELVYREAYAQYNSLYDPILDKLFSKSAVTTFRNFKKAGWEIGRVPMEGALAVWQTYKDGKPYWTGHLAVTGKKDTFTSISFGTTEGNTNAEGGREGIEVAEKNRKLDFEPKENGLVLLGFVYPEREALSVER